MLNLKSDLKAKGIYSVIYWLEMDNGNIESKKSYKGDVSQNKISYQGLSHKVRKPNKWVVSYY